MHVMTSGILKGFVTIHPKWAGFSEDDYYIASGSLDDGLTLIPSKPLEVALNKGNIDLSGYELVRSQFLSTFGRLSVTVSSSSITFSRSSLVKIPDEEFIELLFNPQRRILAVRSSAADSRYSVRWCKKTNGEYIMRNISGSAFLPTIFRMCGWKNDGQYKVYGNSQTKDDDTVLLFNMSEAIMLLNEDEIENALKNDSEENTEESRPLSRRRKKINAYPTEWSGSFGDKYYKSLAIANEDTDAMNDWNSGESGNVVMMDESGVTSSAEAAVKINTILKEIGAYDE